MEANHCLKSVQMRSFFWYVFSCIWTEYGDLLRESPYSLRIQENTDQKKHRIWILFMQCIFRQAKLTADENMRVSKLHFKEECFGQDSQVSLHALVILENLARKFWLNYSGNSSKKSKIIGTFYLPLIREGGRKCCSLEKVFCICGKGA